ncbi:MAG: hypothetical protein Q7R89_01265 [bacterium]|nr:hypothetical protein [bacterium]
MVRTIGLFLVLVFSSLVAEGFDENQIPNFEDGQWEFLEEGPLLSRFLRRDDIHYYKNGGIMISHGGDVWGRVRTYRLKSDPLFMGYEDYAYKNSLSFSKRWGRLGNPLQFAIRDRLGNLILQSSKDNIFPRLVPEIRDGKVIGVAVRFKTSNGSSELYFPDPDYPSNPG